MVVVAHLAILDARSARSILKDLLLSMRLDLVLAAWAGSMLFRGPLINFILTICRHCREI